MLAVLTLICVLLFLPLSLPQLGKGAAQTLSISFLSIAFSTIGGVVYGVLRTLNARAINLLLRIYLELFRAIPVLVWLYLLFFGLPIGLSAPQLYGYVLLPQALKRMTPPTINVYTRIIKTSSLAVLIGVVDVIKVGQQIIERTYESVLI